MRRNKKRKIRKHPWRQNYYRGNVANRRLNPTLHNINPGRLERNLVTDNLFLHPSRPPSLPPPHSPVHPIIISFYSSSFTLPFLYFIPVAALLCPSSTSPSGGGGGMEQAGYALIFNVINLNIESGSRVIFRVHGVTLISVCRRDRFVSFRVEVKSDMMNRVRIYVQRGTWVEEGKAAGEREGGKEVRKERKEEWKLK